MKKKILLTAFDFPPQWGGVATYSWELAQSLHQLGHEVIVVTRKRAGIPLADFQIVALPMAKSGMLSFPFLTAQILPLLRRWQPDHIICTLWLPGALASYIAIKLLGKKIPFSIAVHGMEIVESNTTLLKRLRGKLTLLKQKCFTHAAHCFCVSQFTKDLLLQTVKMEPERVHVVNNGVNANNFSRKSSQNSLTFPTLLTACRLMPNKGIDQVIRALPRMVQEFPNLKYYILGDGPDKARLISLAARCGVASHVEFTGKVDHETLVKHYQKADLFVMLSRREQHLVEGFGLVFLEAALCGTPSLGGASGGIPDAIADGETGWLVDPNNGPLIEAKLLSILRDRAQMQKVADQAYTYTLAHRNWQQVTQQILHHIGA